MSISKKRMMMAFGIACFLVASTKNAEAAAAKKTVYVITEAICDCEDLWHDTYTFDYNSAGKISKIHTVFSSTKVSYHNMDDVDIYKYDKKGRFKKRICSHDVYYTYKYDRYDRATDLTCHYYGLKNDNEYQLKYDNQGFLVQCKNQTYWKTTFTYDKKGRLVGEKNYLGTYKFTYDKHNNVKTKNDGKFVTNFKSVYRNSRLVKQLDSHSCVWTYKYKKIKVSAKDFAQIKAQQRWILMKDRSPIMEDTPLEGWYR